MKKEVSIADLSRFDLYVVVADAVPINPDQLRLSYLARIAEALEVIAKQVSPTTPEQPAAPTPNEPIRPSRRRGRSNLKGEL